MITISKTEAKREFPSYRFTSSNSSPFSFSPSLKKKFEEMGNIPEIKSSSVAEDRKNREEKKIRTSGKRGRGKGAE